MLKRRFRFGLRTIKTGIAVTLALIVTRFFGNEYPTFACIAAILAMHKTVNGTFNTCKEQIIGTAFGAIMGCLYISFLPPKSSILIGCGILIIIVFCNYFNINIAIALSCIVYCSICLNEPGSNNILYSLNRFTDTSIGLIIALVVNALIKPYNNLPKIYKMITNIQQSVPQYIIDKVFLCKFPELTSLNLKMKKLEDEINIFENEMFKKDVRKQDAAHLRSCQQLLSKMMEELSSICHMDSTPTPTDENLEKLAAMGVKTPETWHKCEKATIEDNMVFNFHLEKLLDANNFLTQIKDI